MLIEIEETEYNRLLNSDLFLDILQAQGVDNWCGYDEACTEYRQELEKTGRDDED